MFRRAYLPRRGRDAARKAAAKKNLRRRRAARRRYVLREESGDVADHGVGRPLRRFSRVSHDRSIAKHVIRERVFLRVERTRRERPMATISIAKKHRLSHKKAKDAAEEIARDLKSRFALDYAWSGDRID